MQAAAPIASYPLVWPLLMSGAATAQRAAPTRIAGVLGVGFFLLQADGPGIPAVATLPLSQSGLLLWPLMPEVDRRAAFAGAPALAVAAIGVAL